MAKRSCSLRELKKILSKAPNKHSYSSRYIFRSDYDYSLSSDIECDEIRQPTERNEKKLDNLVTNNIKKKNQRKDDI